MLCRLSSCIATSAHMHSLSHCVCMFTYVCACMCVFMCVFVRSCLCVTVLPEVKEQPFCCSSGSVYLDFETVSMTGHPLISNNHLIPAPWRWDQKYAGQYLGFFLSTMVANWNSNYEHMNTLISLKTCRYCCVTEFVFSQMIPGAESWQQWVLVRPSAFPVPVSYADIFFSQSLTTVQSLIEVLLSALTLCYCFLCWCRVSHSVAGCL